MTKKVERKMALTNTNICMKCLKKQATHQYIIYARGYGSILADNSSTKFQLCNDCHEDKFYDWVNEEPTINLFVEKYKFENDILDFIESLSIESQELFFNRFYEEKDCSSILLPPQVWIDHKLDILSHKTSKQYHLVSPSEKRCYLRKFPKCRNVKYSIQTNQINNAYIIIRCHRSARADVNLSNYNNISTKCYRCKDFKKRESDIDVTFDYEHETYSKHLKNFYFEKKLKDEKIINIIVIAHKKYIDQIKNISKDIDIEYTTIKLKDKNEKLIICFNNIDDIQLAIFEGLIIDIGEK